MVLPLILDLAQSVLVDGVVDNEDVVHLLEVLLPILILLIRHVHVDRDLVIGLSAELVEYLSPVVILQVKQLVVEKAQREVPLGMILRVRLILLLV